MPRCRVVFEDVKRKPEVREVEEGRGVMIELCKIYQLEPPLTPKRMRESSAGIREVWLLDGNDKPKRCIWP